MIVFTYRTSPDQIQCQVLTKGKQEMKLEVVKQKKKGSCGGGWGGPTAENCSFWYLEKHWNSGLECGTEQGRDTPSGKTRRANPNDPGKSGVCPHHATSDRMSNSQRSRVGKENDPFDWPHRRLRGHVNTGVQEQTPLFSPKQTPLSKQPGGLQKSSTGSPATWDGTKTRRGRREGSGQRMAEAKVRFGAVLLGSIPVLPYYTTCSLPSTEHQKTQRPLKAKQKSSF